MPKYEPEILGTLQRVFDQIWQEIEPNLDPSDAELKRTEVARMIVLAHRSGVKLEDIRTTVLSSPLLERSGSSDLTQSPVSTMHSRPRLRQK
jgi:hypothetical protein